MKILPFRTRLYYFLIKTFYLAMQLSIFRLPTTTVVAFFSGCQCLSLQTRLVGSNGLGPSTSRLSGVCSNQLSYEPACGGGNRVRTDDPLLAGQVLYQLSYTPIKQTPSFFLRKAFRY